MNYRIGSGDTPYLLFGAIFLVLLVNITLDLLFLSKSGYRILKTTVLTLSVLLVLGSAFVSAIIVRHRVAPVFQVHDIILQQEAAIRYLIQGRNPYAEDYFGTLLEDWHYSDTEKNPALYHFVMQPFYLVSAVPFYFAANAVVGYFDGRMPLYLLFGALLFLAYKIPGTHDNKRLFVMLTAFNPAMLSYILEGRSDIYMYAFMVLGFYLLSKNSAWLAGIPLGVAFVTKQSAWPLFPFYIAYLWFTDNSKPLPERIKTLFKKLLPFGITVAIFAVPFLLWDARSYMESTVLYLTGSLETSYPISGYGFGMVLYQLGVISDIHAYYPFGIWQVVFGLPVLLLLLRHLKKHPHVDRMIVCYSIFLSVYWYFSRYFNNSHAGFLSMVFITAYFWQHAITIRSSKK